MTHPERPVIMKKIDELRERLEAVYQGDHERGCDGRCYTCECGFDEETCKAAEEAAATIRALREALVPFAAFEPVVHLFTGGTDEQREAFNEARDESGGTVELFLWEFTDNEGARGSAKLAHSDFRNAAAALEASQGREG